MSSSTSLCVVTGANTGIGFEIATGVARAGYSVVLACRDAAKAREAELKIRKATGSTRLESLIVDLSSRDSIAKAAEHFAQTHSSLDVLINNAGVAVPDRRENAEGVELTFAINVLGYHWFTRAMLPLLKNAADRHSARVVSVASMYAFGLDLHDPEFRRRPYDGGAAYAASKQADRMWTWALARRLNASGVTVNAMHPGVVGTRLLHALAPGMQGRSAAQGADTTVWLATDPHMQGVTGRFFLDRREEKCEFRIQRKEEELWELLESYGA